MLLDRVRQLRGCHPALTWHAQTYQVIKVVPYMHLLHENCESRSLSNGRPQNTLTGLARAL